MMNADLVDAKDVLERLKRGNREYLDASFGQGDISQDRRRETCRNGQHPYAVVLTCSDSRVIPEAIFSTGIGELFVIRVAGNVVGDHEMGSIEYAVEHLGCRLVVVLGHDHCGAVAAALHGKPDGHVHFLTDEIRAAIGNEVDEVIASRLNARNGCRRLMQELCLAGNEREALLIVPALYRVETGVVEFESDCTC